MILKLHQIRTDGHTQPRCAIDDATVAEYAELMAGGKQFPPLKVFNDGASYWLADGFHRYWAATRCKLPGIHCNVQPGTQRDAILFSVGANSEHGLRRTNADKRKAVETLLQDEEWSKWSDRQIAEKCAVSHTFVAKVREEPGGNGCHLPARISENGQTFVSGSATPPPPQRVTGADGKSYPRPPPPPLTRTPPPPPPAKAPVVRDEIGREIPEALLELWSRRDEAQQLLTAVSTVRSAVRKAQDAKDPLFSEVNFSHVMAHLDQAYTSLKTAKPYALCPYCHGMKCRTCNNTGLVSQFRWDTVCAKEFKDAAIEEGKKA